MAIIRNLRFVIRVFEPLKKIIWRLCHGAKFALAYIDAVVSIKCTL